MWCGVLVAVAVWRVVSGRVGHLLLVMPLRRLRLRQLLRQLGYHLRHLVSLGYLSNGQRGELRSKLRLDLPKFGF